MADLIVRDDLVSLLNDLNSLIGEFEGALDFQNEDKGLWGQQNANSSMGDFAANWRIHRDSMVKDMKSLRDSVDKINQAWQQGDQQLADSLNQQS
ncbi:hypothetical protein [Catenulispora pinisilvae]|uniref:hypothetical protein n=1 Tax=Catenulispora pinisilvae TaxID=2705253 RepID=UPI001890EDC9|nr:hypothetical protein [Catenulispora pinisilvae]